MKVIAAPSPNFDTRKHPVSMIVLHYTGMQTGQAALDRMCDPAAKVSAHYMVEEDGRVFQLVDERHRAWHAGVGYWRGQTDINSASVGIEIVNGGHDSGLPSFPHTQIGTVIELCQKMIRRYCLGPWNIVGHSDIAPGRKQDPGQRFPWKHLAEAGIGIWPVLKPGRQGRRYLDKETFRDNLVRIGYRQPQGRAEFSETVMAMQTRFRPGHITGYLDEATGAVAAQLAKRVPESGRMTFS